MLRKRTTEYGLIALLALLLAACGSSSVASQPTSQPATAIQIQAADFKVTSYQGDETFGGHDGHFLAAFASGKPVVLLYYGGL